jgi:ankyrin repeat protein
MTRHERLDCVVALVVSGANINSQDNDGNTALHIACKIQNTTIVRALLVFFKFII